MSFNSLFLKSIDLEKINISYTTANCYLGKILIVCKQNSICNLFLEEMDFETLHQFFTKFDYSNNKPAPIDVKKLLQYIENPINNQNILSEFTLEPIFGTAFQHKVWQTLQKIQIGTTVSYAELARMIGHPKAYRAVATACALNPIAILIPCHRVIKSDGSLSQYHWGIERKRALLKKEDVII